MECKCEKCGMGVKNLMCSKCDTALVSGSIHTADNTEVMVAKCPKGCGQIKSPTCCGMDMTCST